MGKIDLEKMRGLEKERYINIQRHPETELLILNYTPQTQYERFWTPETLAARGLITDLQGNIVARPFPKFFNLDEHSDPLPNESFEVYEKMDGSLGILYFADGQPTIATRGSFNSLQSMRANEILQKRYGHVAFDPGITYLFEIIYPENRIVVDYGATEDLVLLAMIETRTGQELPLQDIGMPLVRRYDGLRDLEEIRLIEDSNREGFVIRFESGFRVKLKFEEYVRLHRIINGVTERTIWQFLAEGVSFDQLLDRVPDEFYQWVKDTVARLQAEYKVIEEICQREYKVLPTRKETAAYFMTKGTFPKILFRMLDGKSYAELIWRQLRPQAIGPNGRLISEIEE